MVNSRGIVGAIAALSVVHACTIVAVTKEASADKTPLTAHTDDAGSGAADLRLVYVPAADYENGTERAVYSFKPGYPRVTTWQRGPHYEPKAGETLSEPLGYIPQVAHTYAYFDQDYGMMNEVQLSIAERPMNASAVWAAQRVPPGHVAAVANGFIIRQLNLTDSANYMASSNVESFALSMGWWDPSAGPFDFTAAYNYHAPDGAIGPLYVGRRIWRILDWYAPSLKLNATLGESTLPTYPFSVLTDKPVTLDSLFTLLKDHYEGTPFDMTKGLAAGPFGNPVRYATRFLRQDAATILLGVVGPLTMVVVNRFDGPTYGIDGGWERSISILRGGTIRGCALLRWIAEIDGRRVFDFVNNWSLLRFNAINAEVRAEANVWQARAVADQHSWRQKKDVTIATLQAANNAFADQVFQAWWALAWRLVSKFSDGYITTGEGEADTKTPGYPAAWLRQTEFFNWPGTTFHPPPGEVVTELAPAAHSAAGRSTWSSLALVVTGVAVGMWAQNARRSFVRRSQYERLL
ncbi:hypothetical protein DYB32_002527 [Aphanomyces invadans]|uniref:Uncharacterized protein n=1 Tax=Aphanomyces invadans TaxID=157072 RepID=A0A418B373_9STRA|nr:hypothetical protein DYB32_002527 [Aphanomyces invadans]